jgi:hypothetical protein
MKLLIEAEICLVDDTYVLWALNTRPAVEALGLGAVHASGRVSMSGDPDAESDLAETVSLAIELLAARLGGLADSTRWKHRLL